MFDESPRRVSHTSERSSTNVAVRRRLVNEHTESLELAVVDTPGNMLAVASTFKSLQKAQLSQRNRTTMHAIWKCCCA